MYEAVLCLLLSAFAGRSLAQSYANASSSTIPATSSVPYNTNISCCNIVVNLVALNFWYTKPVEVVNEILVTEYLQYNNTVITTTSTQYPNRTYDFPTTSLFALGVTGLGTPYPGVPTDLVASYEGDYQATLAGVSTIYTDDYTTVWVLSFSFDRAMM